MSPMAEGLMPLPAPPPLTHSLGRPLAQLCVHSLTLTRFTHTSPVPGRQGPRLLRRRQTQVKGTDGLIVN